MAVDVLLFWLLLCLILSSCHNNDLKCGHDSIIYDIVRNDNIQPRSAKEIRQEKLFNLYPKYYGHRNLLDIQSNSGDEEKIANSQVFSSRKNTLRHKNHLSPHAFEHNIHQFHDKHDHHRHIFPTENEFSSDSNPNPHSLENELKEEFEQSNIKSTMDKTIDIDEYEWKPFRIYANTDVFQSDWKNLEASKHFIDDVIPAAIDFLENALKVRPVVGKLRLGRHCIEKKFDSWENREKCVSFKHNWDSCGGYVHIPDSDFSVQEIYFLFLSIFLYVFQGI